MSNLHNLLSSFSCIIVVGCFYWRWAVVNPILPMLCMPKRWRSWPSQVVNKPRSRFRSRSIETETWAAPRILRWGVQNRIRERNERTKNFCTPLFRMCGTSKQIPVGAYWIYWNLLSDGCRINKHRSKDHFHWTAPPRTPLVPKVGDIVPHTPRLRRPWTETKHMRPETELLET